MNTVDTLIWHFLASLFFPAAFVQFTLKNPEIILHKFMNPKVSKFARYGTVGMGFLIIPFMIYPLDNFTDSIMNTTFRKL